MRGEFVDIGSGRIYYYAAGSRGAGDPVVLVHGFPTSSRIWHGVVRDFPAGYRLVVCDLPGFGRSDPPHAGAASGTAHALAVRALLDELRIARAVLVGHGLGGGVVQAFVAQWPERVSAFALVSSAAFGVAPRRLARMSRALGPLARVVPPGLLAGLTHGSVRRGFADVERSRLTLDTCFQAFTTRSGRDALAAHIEALDRCHTARWSTALGSVRCPAAVIWGEDDPFYPVSLAERLQAAIPGASLEVIPGARHFVPEDSPDQLRRALVRLLDAIPPS